jgi:hypothetical protein
VTVTVTVTVTGTGRWCAATARLTEISECPCEAVPLLGIRVDEDEALERWAVELVQ